METLKVMTQDRIDHLKSKREGMGLALKVGNDALGFESNRMAREVLSAIAKQSDKLLHEIQGAEDGYYGSVDQKAYEDPSDEVNYKFDCPERLRAEFYISIFEAVKEALSEKGGGLSTEDINYATRVAEKGAEGRSQLLEDIYRDRTESQKNISDELVPREKLKNDPQFRKLFKTVMIKFINDEHESADKKEYTPSVIDRGAEKFIQYLENLDKDDA